MNGAAKRRLLIGRMAFTFSRFAYLDTNILSDLAKKPHAWPRLARFLAERDLTIAVSVQVSELSEAPRLHPALAAMLTSLPSAVIKQWDTVLDEEVHAHPLPRSSTLLLYPLNALLVQQDGPSRLEKYLGSADLGAARREQRQLAAQMLARHHALKGNFPPASGNAYRKEQATQFADFLTMQWLAETHLSFLRQFHKDVRDLQLEVIRSVRLYAFVLFYKYYLAQRDPTRASDFGDLFSLYALPYCHLAVVERDLANILGQIKRNDPVLASTEVENIDFIRRFAPDQ